MSQPNAFVAGEIYDITLTRRPDLGTIRVAIIGSDEGTPPTPCGAPTVPLRIIIGRLPKNRPVNGVPTLVWEEAGACTSLPPFLADWKRVVA
jgi:hypothetical protein